MSDNGSSEILFPPLETGNNRPVTWHYFLDGVVGVEGITNAVQIFSHPVLQIDESGEHGGEMFAVVTLTRAEIKEILECLEEDIKAVAEATGSEGLY